MNTTSVARHTTPTHRGAGLVIVALVALVAACGPSSPATPGHTPEPSATAAPSASTPAAPSETAPTSATPLLEPAASVNSYYCVTQWDNGPDQDYLWMTVVRDQDAEAVRYDWKRAGTAHNGLFTRIGARAWEDVGQGFAVADPDGALWQQARAVEVAPLFTRFFIDTGSLAGFSTGDELEDASGIMAHVYRAGDAAKAALAGDAAIGSVSTAAYSVSADAGVLVDARISGKTRDGGDFYLTLVCSQYDDPSLVITAPGQ